MYLPMSYQGIGITVWVSNIHKSAARYNTWVESKKQQYSTVCIQCSSIKIDVKTGNFICRSPYR